MPAGFTPFEKIEIGSNLLIRGKVVIARGDSPMLLIGKGTEPRIWLGVPEKVGGVRYLVEDNTSRSPNIRVLHKEDVVSVYFDSNLILQTFKKTNEEATVTHVDLTPLGLTIRADLNSLTVGGNVLSSNTFDGVETMVNVA